MEFEHRPVLLEPTVDALLLPDFGGKGAARSHQHAGPAAATRAEDGVFVDGTFGRGGHSRELLGRLGPSARLVVFDKDPEAIAVARQLAAADPRVTVVHGGFATMAEELEQLGIGKVDGVMLDLAFPRLRSMMPSAVSRSCEMARSICGWTPLVVPRWRIGWRKPVWMRCGRS